MTVTATLVSGQSPQLVQIVIDSIADGDRWSLVGVVGDVEIGLLVGLDTIPDDDLAPADTIFTPTGYAWRVPGGFGVGDGGQVVLVDNRSPGNVPFRYVLTTDSGEDVSGSLEVQFPTDMVLQTIDGQRTLSVELLDGSLDFELPTSVAQFRIPGRARPVIRYDVIGDLVSSFNILVPVADSPRFRALIASGQPLVYRLGATVMDLQPVDVVQLTSVSAKAYPTGSLRVWALGYVAIDDPNRNVRLGAFTWDTFDEAAVALDWDGFDAAFVGLSWDQFDTTDWSSF